MSPKLTITVKPDRRQNTPTNFRPPRLHYSTCQYARQARDTHHNVELPHNSRILKCQVCRPELTDTGLRQLAQEVSWAPDPCRRNVQPNHMSPLPLRLAEIHVYHRDTGYGKVNTNNRIWRYNSVED